MDHELIGFIAFSIVVISILPYAWEIFRGRSDTSLSGWAISTLTGIVTYITYRGIGAEENHWIAAVEIADPLLVVIAALAARNILNTWRRPDTEDWIALVIGCGALVVHILAHNEGMARLAYWGAIIADVTGAIQIIRFAWKEPWEEQPFPWALSIVGVGLSFFSIQVWSLEQVSLPLYQLGFCLLIFIPAFLYRLRLKESTTM
jgi:hypothetical protein